MMSDIDKTSYSLSEVLELLAYQVMYPSLKGGLLAYANDALNLENKIKELEADGDHNLGKYMACSERYEVLLEESKKLRAEHDEYKKVAALYQDENALLTTRLNELKAERRVMSDKSVAGIVPMKTLMPVFTTHEKEKIIDQVLHANKLLTELHDYVQMNIPGSRERALVLTKLEEAHHWLISTQAT